MQGDSQFVCLSGADNGGVTKTYSTDPAAAASHRSVDCSPTLTWIVYLYKIFALAPGKPTENPMSLVASSSGRLGRKLCSQPARQFAAVGKPGLRRPKGSGTRAASRPTKVSNRNAGNSDATPLKEFDPRLISSELAAEDRIAGTDAVRQLTPEQNLSNYAMAVSLIMRVCKPSALTRAIENMKLASVGGADSAKRLIFGADQEAAEQDNNPGFEEFLKEANEGRSALEAQEAAERTARGEARELAELEDAATTRLTAEGVEDVIVAGANADQEREMAIQAGFESGETPMQRRPLWKRVFLFWRRE
ncbi:hypothetical protein THAOC_01767 [Thalassiosira oceanica]|uniref:Uncharacterized protein n=1 Tax=Thalassiosira oceanica TaxID=159749 RepID=K0TMS2_THAOC|nr:hypothetical protein THAOC_01767 [Thalassiosira oceanica]|eukprot:EJK76471.1 hypothetical protein THAOC_01767 [Thalassiosira oceanica]